MRPIRLMGKIWTNPDNRQDLSDEDAANVHDRATNVTDTSDGLDGCKVVADAADTDTEAGVVNVTACTLLGV